jgi:hypothetical protein
MKTIAFLVLSVSLPHVSQSQVRTEQFYCGNVLSVAKLAGPRFLTCKDRGNCGDEIRKTFDDAIGSVKTDELFDNPDLSRGVFLSSMVTPVGRKVGDVLREACIAIGFDGATAEAIVIQEVLELSGDRKENEGYKKLQAEVSTLKKSLDKDLLSRLRKNLDADRRRNQGLDR